MTTSSIAILQFAPAALDREQAAAYLSLGRGTFEKFVQQGLVPKPRHLGGRRVAWIRAELDAWLLARPESNLLPPEPGQAGGSAPT